MKKIRYLVVLTCGLLFSGATISQPLHASPLKTDTSNQQSTKYQYVPNPSAKIQVNNQDIFLGDPMYTSNTGHLVLPVKYLFDALAVEYTWNGALQTVFAHKDNKVIVIRIGSDELSVNGQMIPMDCEATLLQDRTMIPLRAVSEALGAKVSWDDVTETANIESINSTSSDAPVSQTNTNGTATITLSGLTMGGK